MVFFLSLFVAGVGSVIVGRGRAEGVHLPGQVRPSSCCCLLQDRGLFLWVDEQLQGFSRVDRWNMVFLLSLSVAGVGSVIAGRGRAEGVYLPGQV